MIQKLKESQIKTNSTNYKQFLHFPPKKCDFIQVVQAYYVTFRL